MTKNKIIAILLMIIGASIVIGVGLFVLDGATSPEPDGLGTWILAVLGLVLGASSGIKGWLDWNRKDKPSQVTNITANDDAQVATGEHGRNIKQGDDSQYFENVEHYHEAPKPDKPISRLHQLPQPPADFTGREELIDELLKDFKNSQGATISGLTGMGGIGKTALGLKVAHQIADDYPDAQIFLDLKGTTEPLSAVDIARHVILSFEPTADLRMLDETNFQPVYQSVMHGKKALLFFDNTLSADQIAPLTPPKTCAMLVTSRWTFTIPGLRRHRIDVMGDEEAKDFLLEICPKIEENAPELAKTCGYLPLALRIAGSFLRVNDNYLVENYLNQLGNHKKRLPTLNQSRKNADLSAEPDLLATFEMSYNSLSEEYQKYWQTLGVFPASFTANAVSAMWEMDENETIEILSLLRRYNLLGFDDVLERYSMHNLLTDYAILQMNGEDEIAARISHAVYYSKVLFGISQLYLEGGENILLCFQLYDTEWLNIEAGQRISFTHIERNEYAAEACNVYAGQASINNLRLKATDQIRWLEGGIKASKVLRNKQDEEAHLGNLGIVYNNLGDTHKALELYEQALEIAQEIGDRRGEGNAIGNLGNAYMNIGKTYKAIQFFEQQLAIERELGDRRGEGNALGNLGVAYKSLGDIHKALELYGQATIIDRETGDWRGLGTDLSNLGNIYINMGNVQKAIEYHEQALIIFQEIGDKRGEGSSLGNLGVAYKSLGDIHKALELYEQALEIAQEIGNRRGEGNALFNMGIELYSLEDNEKAIDLVIQALKIYEMIGSPFAERARNILKEWGVEEQGRGELWDDE